MRLKLYEIRYCKREEYEKLRTFFYDYWKKDHIFCKSKSIFEFQYGTADNGYYDFVIALHKETEEIHAVLGFIRSSLYDKRDLEKPQAIYGALWKVRDDVENREIGKLGLGVLDYLLQQFPYSSYISLGLSKYSQMVYQGLHFEFGVMKHYYIANAEYQEFQIIDRPALLSDYESNHAITVKFLEEPYEVKNLFYPDKNIVYINNRYINHPCYKYQIVGIYKDGQLMCEWIVRKISIGTASCFRIVDMIGSIEGLDNLAGNIISFLNANSAEYIDCYNAGIDSKCFEALGFHKVDGETIVPNYFEPFERRNVDLYYASFSKIPVVIFKGDGDQDRPNIIL